ncbi:MAG: DUF2760 domain-containing protein [Opitutales bacterium]
MKFLIPSLLLLLVNAVPFIPELEQYRLHAGAISLILSLYLVSESVRFVREERETRERAGAPPSRRAEPAPPAAPPPSRERAAEVDAEIVHFLSLLQERGRFVDFLMDDITPYSNEQVGAAARVVHQGCGEILKEFFEVSPLHQKQEGEPVTVEPGYETAEYRMIGSLPESPPFQGTLVHRGWKTASVKLPRILDKKIESRKGYVIAPSEVEIR